MSDFATMKRKAFTRLFLDSYRHDGDRDEAWDTDAIAAINLYIDFVCNEPGTISKREQMKLTSRVIEQGCTDPRLQYIQAFFHYGYSSDIEAMLELALEGFERVDCPAYCAKAAASRMARYLIENDRPNEGQRYSELSLQRVRQVLEHRELIGEEIRLLYGDAWEDIYRMPDRGQVSAWIDGLGEIPDVDRWLIEMLRGYFEFRMGWEKRGGGFANTVTDDGWRKFSEHHNEAYFHFRKAFEIAPHRPETATMLTDVAIGGHSLQGQDHTFWFEKAMDAQSDWRPAYEKQLHALRPRWHGSFEDMYDLGLRAKNSGHWDSGTPKFLINALKQIALDSESLDFLSQGGVYDEVADVLRYYAEHDPPRDRYDPNAYYTTSQIIFAWAAGEYEEARRLREPLKRLDQQAVKDFAVRGHLVDEEIFAYTSGIGPLLVDAETALSFGNVEDALDHYQLAYEQFDPQQDRRRSRLKAGKFRTGSYRDPDHVARDRAAVLQIYLDLQGGDWVDLTFDETLSGWWAEGGRAEYVDERSIELGAASDGLTIVHGTPVGRRWEMAGEIDFSNVSHDNNFCNAGVLIAVGPRHPKADYQQVSFYKNLDSLRLRRGTRNSVRFPMLIDDQFTFGVQVWDNAVAVYMNDQLIHAGELPTDGSGWWPGSMFGLGGQYQTPNWRIIYRNLRLRLLANPPEALQEVIGEMGEQDR